MSKMLTKRQQIIYNYIKQYIQDNNYPPTVRDIARDLNKGVSTVHDYLVRIEQRGYIKVPMSKPRAIQILK